MPEDGEGDHLVKNAAELVAATHVADDHDVGIDHAGRLGSRLSLVALAQATQSIQSFLRGGGSDHVDSPFRSTSMKLIHDCVNEITPELLHRNCNRRAVKGHVVATSASSMRECGLVLRFSGHRARAPTL